MTSVQDDTTAPAVRFKRRKVTHPKRVYADESSPTVSGTPTTAEGTSVDAPTPLLDLRDGTEAVPNLKEIIRNRKRPRDRLKEVARKAEAPRMEVAVAVEAPPSQSHYSSRFIAQTGQVVDRDDQQMWVPPHPVRLAQRDSR